MAPKKARLKTLPKKSVSKKKSSGIVGGRRDKIATNHNQTMVWWKLAGNHNQSVL